ncbi:hypothetical protein, partial [Citrobacter freundii complex sp. 2024EL-00748]|uniref:hypothetical protein n=1 Tax=Citrobacter freundii complex sp. 2024EL-00748 TaxID=3382813 RepID=UPI003BC3DD10
MTALNKQALRVPERKRHDWSQAVMRDCDFCSQWSLTVKHEDGGCICASGLAPIFPYTFYHLTHYWFAAADIPV